MAVTRPAASAAPFAEALADAGAEPVVAPLIRIVGPADPRPLDEAAASLEEYDWLVFTSANAVASMGEALGRVAASGGRSRRYVSGNASQPRVAAVGVSTAAAARDVGFEVATVPAEQVGAAVAGSMAAVAPLAAARILWPRAEAARTMLGEALRTLGAEVTEIVAYRTMADASAAMVLSDLVRRGAVDVLTFTSPSAVSAYTSAGGSVAPVTVVAVIGPVTAHAARDAGLPVHVEPAERTTAAMIEALRAFFGRPPSVRVGT